MHTHSAHHSTTLLLLQTFLLFYLRFLWAGECVCVHLQGFYILFFFFFFFSYKNVVSRKTQSTPSRMKWLLRLVYTDFKSFMMDKKLTRKNVTTYENFFFSSETIQNTFFFFILLSTILKQTNLLVWEASLYLRNWVLKIFISSKTRKTQFLRQIDSKFGIKIIAFTVNSRKVVQFSKNL